LQQVARPEIFAKFEHKTEPHSPERIDILLEITFENGEKALHWFDLFLVS
jgi:hypothetical protein